MLLSRQFRKIAMISVVLLISVPSFAFDFKQTIANTKKILDKNQIDLLVGQQVSMIQTKLQLTEGAEPSPTNAGIGFSTVAGAHIGLAKNAKVTAAASFMFDGINPVEEEDLYGVNLTRLGITATYDHLVPFTIHRSIRFYGSIGISGTMSWYSNAHDLDWGGYADNKYSDTTVFEAGLVAGFPIDYSINKDFGVVLTPFMDYNFSVGTTQLIGARLSVRFF